jgi:hypothetical protein
VFKAPDMAITKSTFDARTSAKVCSLKLLGLCPWPFCCAAPSRAPSPTPALRCAGDVVVLAHATARRARRLRGVRFG